MRIGIQMRSMDKESGFRALTSAMTREMVELDPGVTFVLLYQTRKWLGQFAKYPNVEEVLIEMPTHFLWDQVAVPLAAHKHRIDVLFNTKFFAPFISPCPVTMGLQEPSWWTRPAEYDLGTRLYQRLAIPLLIRRCAHLFPNSNFILEENRAILGLPIRNATVTYSAAEERFQPVTDAGALSEFRRKYTLPEKFIGVVTRVIHPGSESGAFFPGKNPEVAFRAFARVRNEIPQELVFFGGRVRDYLLQTEGPKTSFDRVRFVDRVPFEELHLLYNAMDIFVNPCVYEGCPNTVLQALACGRPAIVAATGGSADVGQGAALLAKPMDDADLADIIKRVALDSELQARMAQDSLRRSASFSWRKSAADTLAVLKKIGSALTHIARIDGDPEPREPRRSHLPHQHP